MAGFVELGSLIREGEPEIMAFGPLRVEVVCRSGLVVPTFVIATVLEKGEEGESRLPPGVEVMDDEMLLAVKPLVTVPGDVP